MKPERRRHAVVHCDGAQLGIAGQGFVHTFEHQLAVVVGELQAGDPLRLLDNRFRDGRLVLCQCHQRPDKDSRAQAEG